MSERCCPYCQQVFSPSKCHTAQIVCSQPGCQQQRRSSYRRKKITVDPSYREACRQSARQWRKEHPGYWHQYRTAHPETVERNRELQRARDRKQHLKNLANNISASELTLCPATVWVRGAELHTLANNTSAPAQIWILEAVSPKCPPAGDLANNIALAP